MSGRLCFSTDGIPERERFPAFCEEVIRRYTALDFSTDDESRFHAKIELQRVGSIDIGHNFTSAIKSARTGNLVRDGDDSLLVTLVQNGEGFQTQCENDQRLAPGDAIICDCGYPGELNFATPSQFWNLKIPRRKIAALLPNVAGFAGLRLDKDIVARRLLFGYLAGAVAIDLNGSMAAQLYEDHIIELVALALGAGAQARDIGERQSVAAVRRAAVLHEIEAIVGDPNASAAAVATRLGISPRYLRMLLEKTGRSFSEHLLEKRLHRAYRMLRDPIQRQRKIVEIAFACGFGDLSYFNRAFRRRYGGTPSDVRAQARRDDA